MYLYKLCNVIVHMQILPTCYIGLIFHSTAVATASWEYLLGYSDASVTGATGVAVAAEHSTIKVLRLADATAVLCFVRPM